MLLRSAEYAILRQLELTPGIGRYDLFLELEKTDFALPMQTVYRTVPELWRLAAIEAIGEKIGKTGHTVTLYELSDAGRSSLAELRAFLEVQ